MKKIEWFQRQFTFGLPLGMLPFYLERLQGTIWRIEAKVKDVSDEVLSQQLEGKWSIKQNIGHLAEVDEIANRRIAEIVSGISPMSPAVFEPKEDYNAMPIANVVERFSRKRRDNLQAYASLGDTELSRTSVHPRLKVSMSPVDLAYFDAEHDDHHLVRITEILHYHRI